MLGIENSIQGIIAETENFVQLAANQNGVQTDTDGDADLDTRL